MTRNGWKQLKFWKCCKSDLKLLGGLNKVMTLFQKISHFQHENAKNGCKRLDFDNYKNDTRFGLSVQNLLLGGLSKPRPPFWKTSKNSAICAENGWKGQNFENISKLTPDLDSASKIFYWVVLASPNHRWKRFLKFSHFR